MLAAARTSVFRAMEAAAEAAAAAKPITNEPVDGGSFMKAYREKWQAEISPLPAAPQVDQPPTHYHDAVAGPSLPRINSLPALMPKSGATVNMSSMSFGKLPALQSKRGMPPTEVSMRLDRVRGNQ